MIPIIYCTNMKSSILLLLSAVLLSLTLSAQTNISTNITTNTTWTVANSPYVITNSINVNAGITLIVETGVEVRFNSGVSLQVIGTLSASGTKFTANGSTAKGFWDAIYVSDFYSEYGTVILNNCIVEYASNIYIRKGTLTLNSCTINNFSSYGVMINKLGTLNIETTTIRNTSYPICFYGPGKINPGNKVVLTGNTNDYIYLNFQDIPSVFYLRNLSIPYCANYMRVIELGTLIIDPGVQLMMLNNGELTVFGKIKAIGAIAHPIIFDKHPTANYWLGINITAASIDSACVFKNCIIRNAMCNVEYDGAMAINAASPTFENCKFTGNCRNLIVTGISRPTFTNCNFEPTTSSREANNIGLDMYANIDFSSDSIKFNSNEFRAVKILPHTVTDDAHLKMISFKNIENITYSLYGTINIPPEVSLVIDPGVVIKGSGVWNILGRLDVQGTTQNPVVFTTKEDDMYGNPKDMQQNGNTTPENLGSSLCFYGESNDLSTIEHAIFRYSWTNSVQITDASPKILNTTFENLAYPGISLSGLSTPSVNGCTFHNVPFPFTTSLLTYPASTQGNVISGNTGKAIRITDETLTGINDVTLIKRDFGGIENIPYVFGNYTIGPGSKLTISPGIVLKFMENSLLIVQNGLMAIGGGTPDSTIVFTSDRDDLYGGDTYSDGDANQPTLEYWGGIYFQGQAIDDNCILKNCILKNGSYDINSTAGYGAITLNNASPTVVNCLFKDDWYGIVSLNTSLPEIRNCDFIGMEPTNGYGIWNQNSANTVTAEGCWWNSSTGPRHSSNPGGTGERVSDYVDFTPWKINTLSIVTPASVSIGSAAGSSGTFNISSNTSWSITDDGSWLTVSPISGSYNGTITVTASSANTGTSPRSATVTVAGTGVTTKTITVTQEGQINDFDGNPYNTVRIGDQLWFQENLKTTHYRNGDAIQRSDNWAALGNSTDGAYCSWDYIPMYAEIFGRLYNAYATVDNRNLCPSGWHVPSEGEWIVLENYLMANGYNYDGSTTENKIAKAMASSTDWELSSVEGAVGNTDYPEYRNKSGFTGLPGGFIYNDGIFRALGVGAVWWTTSERDATHAVAASIWRDSASEIRSAGGGDLKTSGFSVRCLQGEGLVLPAVTTTAVTDIGTSAATGGGIITNNGGSSVTSRGVCWSTSHNPTISDFKTSDGSGTGSFASTLTGLIPGTTYYARAYASNSTGTAYGNEIRFKTYNADAIQDIEGNYYNIVTIGSQVWMAENLKTTRYNDNNEIPLVTNNTEWSVFSTPAYCWYNNDIANKNIYGALYKRYAVNTGKLCPTGWHVPSEGEWTSLITYLGGENVAGGKLKETDTIHWFSPNTGATNESGFTALPGGARSSGSSMFFGVGGIGTWWSVDSAWYMVSNTSTVTRFGDAPEDGLSVRCLKDMAAEQSINLTEGWNIFSLYVEPTNVDMKTMVQSLIDSGYLLKVQDETGAAIENVFPVGWVNFIGDWKPSEGYKIRVTANTQLNITGYPISNPYSIDLAEGWNMISYPINTSQDALGAVNPLILNGTLVKVQNEAGQAIENVPAIGWINNIYSFDPGEGYKIRVNADDQLVLVIPGLSQKSIALSVEHNSNPSHFKTSFQGYGLDHMNIYVSKTMANNALLEPGDEIAVFDGDICVGKTTVVNPEGLISIIASKDDPTTAETDGFTEGHSISFRLWAAEVERELQSGEVEYEAGYSGMFEAMGTTVANLNASNDSNINDNKPVISANMYPNPFNGELTIEIQNNTKNTNCEILNSLGQIVLKGNLVEKIVLQTSGFSPGVYIIKLENDNAFIIRKIVKE